MNGLDIRFAASLADAQAALEEGYEPVECSFGCESVMGDLQMDHHGAWSHLPGVAVRAHGELFGRRAEDPRFVVTGVADPDAVGAIVGLAGLHRLTPDEAALINECDVDPMAIGSLLARGDAGIRLLRLVQLCRSAGPSTGQAGFECAVRLFLTVYGQPLTPAIREEVRSLEQQRLDRATDDVLLGKACAFACSQFWAFDVWYRLRPIVVAYLDKQARITIGARSLVDATAFGPEGLLSLAQALDAEFGDRLGTGWGGRRIMIGSPRDTAVKKELAVDVFRWVEARLDGLSGSRSAAFTPP